MHIFEVTRNDPATRRQIDQLVGNAFSFLQKFKIGQIGSQGFQIVSFSPSFDLYFAENQDVIRVNLELRPKGIITGFQQGYRSYNWVLPFEDNMLEINETTVIIRQGLDYIRCSPLFNADLDRTFIAKIQDYIDHV